MTLEEQKAELRQYILEYNLEETRAKAAKELTKYVAKSMSPGYKLKTGLRNPKTIYRWHRLQQSKIKQALKQAKKLKK